VYLNEPADVRVGRRVAPPDQGELSFADESRSSDDEADVTAVVAQQPPSRLGTFQERDLSPPSPSPLQRAEGEGSREGGGLCATTAVGDVAGELVDRLLSRGPNAEQHETEVDRGADCFDDRGARRELCATFCARGRGRRGEAWPRRRDHRRRGCCSMRSRIGEHASAAF